jgi:hypothetical protein
MKTEVLGGKPRPSATLSTTNPTWTDPGSNPGLPGGRPAANRLSHGTAPVSRHSVGLTVTVSCVNHSKATKKDY